MMRDHEIGMSRSSTATRFKPGQSGNPSGRPPKVSQPRNTGLGRQLLNVASRKVRVTRDGKTTETDMLEAILLKYTHEAMSGKRIQADRLMQYLMELETAIKQDAADCYSFWTQWCAEYRDKPLNWPRRDMQALVLPHPRDICIDPLTLDVAFVGPLSEDELPLFEAVVVLTELLLIEAERHLWRTGAPDDAHRDFLRAAQTTFAYAAPSLGGQALDDPQGAAQFRLAGLMMDIRSLTSVELVKREAALKARFEHASRLRKGAKRRRSKNKTDGLAELAGSKGSSRKGARR